MDIESKTSIYEEKEETQEVNPEEQKSEIKSEKEKDRVLQTAVIVAVGILVIGGITVALRLSNPQKDTKKGTEILKTMDEMDVSEADKKIKELEAQEREAEQDAEEQPASENLQIVWSWGIPSHRDCTNMVCWIRQMYRQTVEPVCRRGIMKNWQIISPGQKR
mgnify:CR=1 FL=1